MSAVIALRIRLDHADVEAFVAAHARLVGKNGLFLPTAQKLDVGTTVKYELRIADGTPCLVGAGVVKAVVASPEGILVDLSRLSREGRSLVLRMLELRRRMGWTDDASGLPDLRVTGTGAVTASAPAVLSARVEREIECDVTAAMVRARLLAEALSPDDPFDRELLAILHDAPPTTVTPSSVPRRANSELTSIPPELLATSVRTSAIPLDSDFFTSDNERTPTKSMTPDLATNDFGAAERTVASAPSLQTRLRPQRSSIDYAFTEPTRTTQRVRLPVDTMVPPPQTREDAVGATSAESDSVVELDEADLHSVKVQADEIEIDVDD